MQVHISQATEMVEAYIKAKIVPMLVGSPGIGKSQIIHQIAKKYNLFVIDLRLSQCDPTDLLGPLSVSNGRGMYAPMSSFPLVGDDIPEGYSGWLLFLDELTSAPPAVQSSSYKLILDRMVGHHHLHPNVAIVGAGNLADDNAVVHEVSTALQSRMAWIELTVDAKEWIVWAETNGIDHRITDAIKFKESLLYTFKPDHTDKTYASPRTWEFANRLMPYFGQKMFTALLAGTISEGVAREFITFCRIYDSLPKMTEIEATPDKVVVPQEPSVLYAICGSLANHMHQDSATNLMQYIKRLPEEFQIITVKETVRRNSKLLAHSAVQDWLVKSSVELF